MRHSSWQPKGHKMRLIESKRRKGRVVRGKRVKRKRGRQDGFQEENEGEIFKPQLTLYKKGNITLPKPPPYVVYPLFG